MRLDNIKNIRIQNTIKDFVLEDKLKSRFYGYFCQYIHFKSNNHVESYKPFVDLGGMVVSYNDKYIDSLSDEELRFILIFICLQFISNHNLNAVTDEDSYINHLSSTIVISNIITSTTGNNIASNPISIPLFPHELHEYDVYHYNVKHLHNMNDGIKDYIELKYTGRMSYDDLTDKLLAVGKLDPDKLKEMNDELSKLNINDEDDDISDEDSSIIDKYSSELEIIGDSQQAMLEIMKSTFEFIEWVNTDPFFNDKNKSKEYNALLKLIANKQLNIDNVMESNMMTNKDRNFIDNALSSVRNRGVGSGELDRHLDSLTESRVDYMKLIKSKTSNLMSGSIHKKYSKPNRKGLTGIKGKIKSGNAITCILDTSGSMWDSIELVLSTIFKHNLMVNLIQIDAEVKEPILLKSKSDFSKINLQGGGGTELQPAIDYIVENKKYNKHNVVILTDGYTDTLDTSKLKKVLIISVGEECDLVYKGNVTHIIINPDEL